MGDEPRRAEEISSSNVSLNSEYTYYDGLTSLLMDIISTRRMNSSPALLMSETHSAVYVPHDGGLDESFQFIKNLRQASYFLILYSYRFQCVECLITVQDILTPREERLVTIKDKTGFSRSLQNYRKAYSSEHNKWRKRVMKSQGESCGACGSENDLELAHITGVEDFYYRYGKSRKLRYPTARYKGVEYSYREDNLVMLCRKCHDAQTMSWGILAALFNPDDFLDLVHRKHRVDTVFSNKIKNRKWVEAEDLYQYRLPS